MAEQRPAHRGTVDYEQVGADYLEKRQLQNAEEEFAAVERAEEELARS